MIIAVGYRVNSEKEHMGLTNWKNSPDGLIYKYDVIIAKNYLNEEEMNNENKTNINWYIPPYGKLLINLCK